jgi:DNA gyrase subunit B (EC 5.99.1.3)
VAGIVESVVHKELSEYLEKNPKVARAVLQKVLLAAEARYAAKKARELVQKKGPVRAAAFPASSPTAPAKTRKCASYFW